MDMNEFYKFLNESTYIGNINSGQTLVPEMFQGQQSFQPMKSGGQVKTNVYTEGTKAQSNYMNPQKLKDGEWK
tara:strand:- start:869 stop:1087 length:219 start_codon:yes stop_codon:yes gene_type:complete